MALPASKKDLTYSSFEEFRQKTSFDFSKLDFNRPSICNSLLKLYDQGTLCLSTGEDEKAYMLLYRFFEGYLKLKSSKLYKQDRNYVENFISKEKLSKSMVVLETLNEQIKQRYQEREEEKKQITKIEPPKVQPEIKSPIIKNVINPTQFTDLIRQNVYTILLVDIRDQTDFENSRLNLDYLMTLEAKEKKLISYINIPGDLIDTTSWKIVDALAKKDSNSGQIFSQRKNFDFLIFFDLDSFFNDLKSDSKLMILKRAVYEFDLEKVKNEPVILDGGWSQWLVYYPACKTVSIQNNTCEPNAQEKKIHIEYSEVVEQNEVVQEPAQKPEEPNPKPTIDRTNKPKEKEKEKENAKVEPVLNPIENRQKNNLAENELNFKNSTLQNFLPTKILSRVNKPQLQANNYEPLNETIFNSVYAPRFKFLHTPFMKDGDNKVLNPVTGIFSYENKPGGFNAEAKVKNEKNVAKENKPALKRTFSSPNITDLENSAEDKPSGFKTLAKPLVDRANKPSMQENMMVSRIEDLEPVYAKIRPGLTGIRNLGNTCFMNSIIQCLSNTEPFVKYFLSGQFRKDLNRKNKLGFKGEIADEFAVIMNALWTGRFRVISTHRFKFLIEEFNQLFKSNEQQDAQEFLLFLLDGLHEDLNRVRIRPKISTQDDENCESPDKAWKDHLSMNNSIIVDLFQGQFRSTVTCSTCGKKSVKFDAFMYLTLPIFTSKCNLHECLDLFLRSENMSGESKWKCPNCKQYRDATKKIDIWKLPPLLIIHLKRFKYEGVWRDKITSNVDYPIENLDLNRFLTGPTVSGVSNNYRLYGITNHIGTMDGGHYISMCRHLEMDRWVKYDDSDVKELSSTSALKSPASYILFYSRY
ncbi:ubiquitin carboxyl-terminal hydrolase 8 isoform X2 [Brachionus plicatilis]|uniref:Ubiquitin carboxyl-terminal hydrolase n=1 Tax=Brachionus plicatilis TaxID=10195 RepID=A0A3M7RPZ6_BRAPC|nr:ubiquitin carboxyl-terminal hydrolase 8 isoform X2 [Brachionus plicatilis]